MTPIMYALILMDAYKNGWKSLTESPQRTHGWNYTRLDRTHHAWLNRDLMVHERGCSRAMRRIRALHHIPALGGWRDFVVLRPVQYTPRWHVGWITAQHSGVSRIILEEDVRMTIGQDNVSFFGIDEHGRQICIEKIAVGKIGDGGPFSRVQLL